VLRKNEQTHYYTILIRVWRIGEKKVSYEKRRRYDMRGDGGPATQPPFPTEVQ